MSPSLNIIKHVHVRGPKAFKLEGGNETSVTELLHRDHLKVADLFFKYDQLEEDREKATLVQTILRELFIHANVEEELVYPIIRSEASEKETEDLMDESETEHHVVKILMSELSAMEPEDNFYNAKVCVLGEIVRHHVHEEEKYMFAKMYESEIDLEKLAQKCMARKEELADISNQEIADALKLELQDQN